MGSVLLCSAVIFFISFGVINFFLFLVDFVYETKYLKNKKVYTIVPLEKEDYNVEELFRAVKFKVERGSSGVMDNEIIFVDKNDNNATYEALKRLTERDDGIKVLKSEEMLKKLHF